MAEVITIDEHGQDRRRAINSVLQKVQSMKTLSDTMDVRILHVVGRMASTAVFMGLYDLLNEEFAAFKSETKTVVSELDLDVAHLLRMEDHIQTTELLEKNLSDHLGRIQEFQSNPEPAEWIKKMDDASLQTRVANLTDINSQQRQILQVLYSEKRECNKEMYAQLSGSANKERQYKNQVLQLKVQCSTLEMQDRKLRDVLTDTAEKLELAIRSKDDLENSMLSTRDRITARYKKKIETMDIENHDYQLEKVELQLALNAVHAKAKKYRHKHAARTEQFNALEEKHEEEKTQFAAQMATAEAQFRERDMENRIRIVRLERMAKRHKAAAKALILSLKHTARGGRHWETRVLHLLTEIVTEQRKVKALKAEVKKWKKDVAGAQFFTSGGDEIEEADDA